MSTVLIYHPRYNERGFARMQRSWMRYRDSYRLFESLGFFANGLRVERQAPAGVDELLRVHTPEYVDYVRQRDAEGSGFLDGGDTPAYPGVFERARLSVGGSLLGARLIMDGAADHVFNPSGGLHHAQRDRAGGFCIFNDIVIVVRWLQAQGLSRIAVVDVDGHHGDGTQNLLYAEPVLTISLHQYDGRFYPRTGRLEDHGEGAGLGHNINLPLPRRTGHSAYLDAFDRVALPALRAYRPQFVLVQFGTDGHANDPLVGLQLTTQTYQALTERLHAAAHQLCGGRLLLFGGGGYHPETVARCWSLMLGTLAGCVPPHKRASYADLHDGPLPEDAEAAVRVEAMVSDWQRLTSHLNGSKTEQPNFAR
ncbi:MAG: acetoin utilization protein AcuC [Chloroflexi bacterium]|nr:acetoin utilization protein AcuC [Chloroflexota bacterium]